MVNDNPTLCHYLFQISQAQGISQIPSDTLSNNIDGIMQAFEGVSDQKHRQTTSQKNSRLPDDTLMRQSLTSIGS
jgi:hypothetical protein